MKKIVILMMLINLCACASSVKYYYPADKNDILSYVEPKVNKAVTVKILEDSRGYKNKLNYLKSFIPLALYGSAEVVRTDSGAQYVSVAKFDMDVINDLTNSTFYSINKSNLFNKTCDENKNLCSSNYVLEGNLNKFTYEGALYTYGLSVYGSLLHFIGLPAGSSKNIIDIDFKLRDVKSKKVVWSGNYKKVHKHLNGMYYNYGEDVDNYNIMYQEIMNEVVEDLRNTLD